MPEKIRSASMACEGICRWVRAMDVYDKVARIVMPKKAALAEAEGDLSSQMEKLNAKRAELQVILDKLQKLNDFFAEKSREKKRLEDDIDNCEKKLNRYGIWKRTFRVNFIFEKLSMLHFMAERKNCWAAWAARKRAGQRQRSPCTNPSAILWAMCCSLVAAPLTWASSPPR